MKYIKIAIGSVALLIILYLAAISWYVLSEDKIEYLVFDATHSARDFKYGAGYLIPTLTRERLKFINTCPRFDCGNNAIGYITSVHADNGVDKHAALEVAQIFIRVGCKVNAYNKYGMTPLHEAISFNDLDMVKLLLRNGADLRLPIRHIEKSNHSVYSRPYDGMNAYGFAAWLQDDSRLKPNMRAVITEVHQENNATSAGR